jgi:DNA-binding NarL/FixJ family response regulator
LHWHRRPDPVRAVIDVGIVDDHPVVRLALRQYLESHDDMRVVGEATNAVEALDVVRTGGLKVLILDLDLPGRSGLDAMAMLRRQAPKVGVLIFTGYPSEQYALKLFRMGARAFVPKNSELDVLANAVRAVGAGRRWILPSQAEMMLPSEQSSRTQLHDVLTYRELQVLLKLARGVHSAQIADNLALSMKSVSTYRTRLLEKLGVASNSELTYYALKHRLLD